MPTKLPPRRGLGLVVCAPSGTGKTTLCRRLREEFPTLGFSISMTTRSPRAGEEHGKDYHFVSCEEFLQRREQQDFAEWAEVHGNFYGTPLKATLAMLEAGQDVLFDIDVQGAAQLHLRLPNCLFVFCFPPSMQVLEGRLRGRGTETEASICRRLEAARQEMRQSHWFNTWIVNEDLNTAYEALRGAYLAASCAPTLRPSLPDAILEG